jgi:hypothetical protein
MLRKKLLNIFIALGLVIGLGFQSVDAVLRLNGPVNAVNGFPDWYQDNNLLKLGLCIDSPTLCLFDPVDPANPFSVAIGFGAEAFWWSADAALAFTGGTGLLVLAMEAAFVNEAPAEGDQVAFGRVRIRVDVDTPGTYRIIHPFGVLEQVVTAADIGPAIEINVSDDIGNFVSPGPAGDYTVALGSSIGPFLFWDSQLPQTDPAVPGSFYIGNPGLEHAVLGSPFGTNFFRIERDGVLVAETNLFAMQGKVFTGDGNTPPVAVADVGATRLNTPVMLDVLANDTFPNVPINPTSIIVSNLNPAQGRAELAIVNGRPMLSFTPATGFTGTASFNYTVASFTGQTSPPTTVNVEVENLQNTRAVFRPKFMKWSIKGTSSDITANAITARLATGAFTAQLNGAQENPAVNTPATGTSTVTINDAQTAISFSLSVQNIVNVTRAHIHFGAPGVNGPIILGFTEADFVSPLTGTLTAADLQAQPALGINTFADAIRAIQSGNTYVNVHTAANPGGEIRGQLGPVRLIGTGQVGADGRWVIENRLPVKPDEAGTIHIESSNGVQILQLPVSIR